MGDFTTGDCAGCKEARTSQGLNLRFKGYWWAHEPSPRLTISRPCSSHGWLAEAAFTQCVRKETSLYTAPGCQVGPQAQLNRPHFASCQAATVPTLYASTPLTLRVPNSNTQSRVQNNGGLVEVAGGPLRRSHRSCTSGWPRGWSRTRSQAADAGRRHTV